MKTTKLKAFFLALALAIPTAVMVCSPASAVLTDTDVKTISALGNGVTVNFTLGFSFQSNSQVDVYLQDESVSPFTRTLLVYGAGAGKFTISGGDPGTTVVMGTAPTSSQRVVMVRDTPLTQTVDYVDTDAFPADDHEAAMDKMEQSLQELNAKADEKVGLSVATTADTPTFPDPLADGLLAYNHGGTDLTLLPAPTANYIYQFQSGGWTGVPYTGAYILSLIAATSNQLGGANGGTGVNNGGAFTWGSHNLTFTLSGDTTIVLPASGTMLISPLSAVGDLIYGGTAGSPTRLAGNTTGSLQILGQTGTGSASAAPAWNATTGSGNVVMSASPTVTGTVAGANETLSGTLAVTGNVTASSLTASMPVKTDASKILVSATIDNADLTAMAASTVKANVTGGSAAPTDVTAATAATASSFMYRDSAANVALNGLAQGWATHDTASCPVTLTAASPRIQYFTGSTAGCVVTMPATSALLQPGEQFQFHNVSTQSVALKDSGASSITGSPVPAAGLGILTEKTSASPGTWDLFTSVSGAGGGTVTSVAATVPSFLSIAGTPVTTTGTLAFSLSGSALPVTSGGTGLTGASVAGSILVTTGGSSVQYTQKKWQGVLDNASVSASISSNTLVIALKQSAGNNCSGTDPCVFSFRDVNPVNPGYIELNVTAAKSITLSATDSVGNPAGAAANSYVYVYGATEDGSGFDLCVTPRVLDTSQTGFAVSKLTAGADTSRTTIWCSTFDSATDTANVSLQLIGKVAATWSNPNWSAIADQTVGVPTIRLAPTITNLLSGSAATYTTPAGVLYLRIKMVGGGGGGGGSGTTAIAGSNGTATTFGTGTADLGVGGQVGVGGSGGTATLGTGWIGLALTGNGGAGFSTQTASNSPFGASLGGAGCFEGAARSQNYNATPDTPIANSGSGGSGGGSNNTIGVNTGDGGGAGGCIDAIITNPFPTYTYTVGAGGTHGSAGTSGKQGSDGATGRIQVIEYYQ